MWKKIKDSMINLNNVTTIYVSTRHDHPCVIITYINGKQDTLYYKSIRQAEEVMDSIELHIYRS